MAQIEVWAGASAVGLGVTRGVVHIIDNDDHVQHLLASWFTAAGLDSRPYPCLSVFLDAHRAELPSCVVLDARTEAIPCPVAIGCPIVVTAHQADVATAVRAMKTGAVDFVEKPLREQEIVHAVSAAIEINRQERFRSERKATIMMRYAALSRRERQVMALVTAGRLNKQVGGDLGFCEITVKAHRGAVMRKMGARTLAELVRMADALGESLTPA
jgi:FixJ family two-component response regulator